MKLFVLLLFFGPFLMVSAQDFPDAYTGIYDGYLQIISAGKRADSVRMVLDIAPLEQGKRWKFGITYGEAPASVQINNYELLRDTLAAGSGHYLLDEKDGILIRETLAGNTLYAMYHVSDRDFFTEIQFRKGQIHYKLTVFSSKEILETVSAPDEEGNSWEVSTCALGVVQTAVLSKKPE